MQVKGSIALVTGANRGIGKAYVRALLEAGAEKVYAAARNPDEIDLSPRVVPIKLDVIKSEDIALVAALAKDVTLLVNNAGISSVSFSEQAPSVSIKTLREELEVNAIAPLEISLAFAPILASNGGGAIVNMHSALSWINLPNSVTYSAGKAAAWSLTNGLRLILADQSTQVVGVHVAFVDTDMTADVRDSPKADPNDVARRVLQAVEANESEVLADGVSEQIKLNLSNGIYLRPVSGG